MNKAFLSLISLSLILVSEVFAADFSGFSDMCDPTPTQSCPNKPSEIKALQETLNSDPSLYLYIKTDGKWNPGTKAAVIVFQEHYGISPATGYVGPKSRMILQKIAHATTQNITAEHKTTKPRPIQKPKVKHHKAPPTKEFILYGDMCDNNIHGNNCPNNKIEVSNLQILLNADPNLNINIAADGQWGKGTQKAVVAFQKHYHIVPASGYVGARTKRVLDQVAGAMVAQAAPVDHTVPATKKVPNKSTSTPISSWHTMCTETETDHCPNRPEDVKALQKLLKIKADGKWGKGTQSAVIKFQKNHGINPANGYVGRKTRQVIEKTFHGNGSQTHSRATVKESKHSIRTYADFRKYTNYPKTYRVYKNSKLLARANGKNTQIKIDVSEQRMKMYVGGKVALDSPCTTGAKHKLEPNTKTIRNKSTPKGSFRITEKLADKRSTIFGDYYKNGKRIYHGDRRKYRGPRKGVKFVGASLRNWMRLTSSGIGLHASKYVKRYPASNGCVRLPYKVANVVFSKVKPGTQVKIVN